MDKVKEILTSKWFKCFLGILTCSYTILLGYIVYAVTFYDIEYTNKVLFAIIYTLISAVVCALVFYTRKSPFTCAFSMINIVLFLPILLIDFGNWPLLIPGILVTLFSFFCSKMNVTAKTVIGTIFLLMYIIGGIGFYVGMNLFRVKTVDTLLASGTSPSNNFRYYVLNVENKASGKTVVYIEPNNLDVEMDFITLRCTIKRRIMQGNNPIDVICKWNDNKLYINEKMYFDESDYIQEGNDKVYTFEEGDWTYSYFNIDYPLFETVHSLTQKIKNNSSKDNTSQTSTEEGTAAETTKQTTEETTTVSEAE